MAADEGFSVVPPTAVPASGLDLAKLASGRVVEARVASLAEGIAIIATRHGLIQVDLSAFAKAMPAVGDLLRIQVQPIDGSAKPAVTIVEHTPAADRSASTTAAPVADDPALVLARAVREAAASQTGLAPLYATLAGLAKAPTGSVPEGVRALVTQLLGGRLAETTPPNATAVKKAFLGSGLFLEARVAGSGAPPPDDLKAALFSLRAALSSWVGAPAAEAGRGSGAGAGSASPPGPMDGGRTTEDAALASNSSISSTYDTTGGRGAARMGPSSAGGTVPQPSLPGPPNLGAGPSSAPLTPPSLGVAPASAAPSTMPPTASAPTPGGGPLPATPMPGSGAADPAAVSTTSVAAPAGLPSPTTPPSSALAPAPDEGGVAVPTPQGAPAAVDVGGREGRPAVAVAVPVAVDPGVARTPADGPIIGAGGAPSLPPPLVSGPRPPPAPTGAGVVASPMSIAVEDGAPPPPLPLPGVGQAAPIAGSPIVPGLGDDAVTALLKAVVRGLEIAGSLTAARPAEVSAALAGIGAAQELKPPPPRRGQAPRGQAAQPADRVDDAGGVERLGRRALERTEGALSRILLEQFAVLDRRVDDPAQAQEGRGHREWTVEMPIATRQGTGVVQMMVEHDGGRPKPDGSAGPRGWRVRFSLDVEPLGPIHAQIGFAAEKLSIGLWAERRDAAERLGGDVGRLRGALEAAAIPVDSIHLATGRPTSGGPGPSAGHFVDVKL